MVIKVYISFCIGGLLWVGIFVFISEIVSIFFNFYLKFYRLIVLWYIGEYKNIFIKRICDFIFFRFRELLYCKNFNDVV